MSSDSLVQIVDAALASAALRSGPHLVCHPGCSPCCHGVFQISPLDAHRLREGLAFAGPDLRSKILERVAAAWRHLAPFFPGDAATGILSPDENAIELFEEWAHADPCPVLNPVTQTCDLYAHRPILCRTFGPPIRPPFFHPSPDHTEEDPGVTGLSLCELCFTQATPGEIAAAEMDSSFRPLEVAAEVAFLAGHPGSGNTIVALAFPDALLPLHPSPDEPASSLP